VQSIWQMIARSAQAHPLSREQYEQIINMGGRLLNANKAVYIVALLWWIVWLWIDEPGAACACAVEVEEAAASEPGAMKIVEATIEPALEAAKTGEIAPEPTEPSSKNAPPPSAE